MNRLYAIETMPTTTGARADHRLPLKPSADRDGRARDRGASASVWRVGRRADRLPERRRAAKWSPPSPRICRRTAGRSLVIAGDAQPPVVHALAHAMNQALGNVGQTVVYTRTGRSRAGRSARSLRDLVADMNAGKVDLLVILGGNPVYTAPADLGFAEALSKVQLRVHLSLYDDETSALCHWQIPEAHFLEAWSDARGYDGTVVDRAAADRAALRRQVGARSARRDERPARAPPSRSGPRVSGRVEPKDDSIAWRRWLHDGVDAGHGVRAEDRRR